MRKHTPFSISPNPVLLYLTDALEAALFRIRYTVDHRQGLSVVLGDVGVGKTSLIRYAHAELDARDDVTSILIPTPNFNSEYAFIQAVAQAVGLPPRRSVQQHQRELEALLGAEYMADKAVVLFIDEAQKLSTQMLELVRSFLNFETDDAKLIQVVLAGQLELRDRLHTKKMRALFSRIVSPTILAPLSFSETERMIHYRCTYYKIPNPFPVLTLQRVYQLAAGIARDVLRICDVSYQMIQIMKIAEAPVGVVDQAYADLQLQDEREQEAVAV